MAQLLIVGKQEPGKFWEIAMSKTELDKQTCKYCGKSVEVGDVVYLCERCRKATHRDCAPRNHTIWNDICKHSGEFRYLCGRVRLDG